MELKVENLYKSYKKKEALKGINFELKRGTYGLLGENEVGKSTLMVEKVRGKVWETTVEQKSFERLSSERPVIHLKQLGKEVQARYVGDKYPGIESLLVEPTLEDYTCLLEGLEKRRIARILNHKLFFHLHQLY